MRCTCTRPCPLASIVMACNAHTVKTRAPFCCRPLHHPCRCLLLSLLSLHMNWQCAQLSSRSPLRVVLSYPLRPPSRTADFPDVSEGGAHQHHHVLDQHHIGPSGVHAAHAYLPRQPTGQFCPHPDLACVNFTAQCSPCFCGNIGFSNARSISVPLGCTQLMLIYHVNRQVSVQLHLQ
jgi:hypothetical protein